MKFRLGRHAIVALLLVCGLIGYGQIVPWLERQKAIAETSANLVAQAATLGRYKALTDSIQAAMADAMLKDPSLARLRIAFLQAPGTRNNLALLRWDITNAMTRTGHIVGQLRSDLPVSDWSDYFGQMLDHQCANVNINTMQSDATLQRIREMHLKGFIVCPIVTAAGELVGAVFGSWDVGDPDPPDLMATIRIVRLVADKIALAVTRGG